MRNTKRTQVVGDGVRPFLICVVGAIALGSMLAGCTEQASPPLTPSVSTAPVQPVVHQSRDATLTPSPGTLASVPINQLAISEIGGNQGAEVKSISCWSPGNCITGGGYFWGPLGGATTGFLATESNSQWKTAFLVPGLNGLAVNQYSEVTWVSCQQAGYCSAGGYYTDDPNAFCDSCHLSVFVDNEVRGNWYRVISVPGLRNLNQGDSATLDAGACAAVGDCQVVGTYLDANVTFQLYTESEVDGVWQVATQLGHLQKFDPRGDPSFSTIKCSTISDCTATGSYSNSGTFVAVLSDGIWAITEGA